MQIKPFQCLICCSNFVIQTDLDRHMNMKCSTKLKTQTNMKKSNETSNFALPEVHEIRSQPKEDGILEQLGLYDCDICEKSMSNALTLETHYQQIHKSNLAFGCNICSERYPRADFRNQHELCCNK